MPDATGQEAVQPPPVAAWEPLAPEQVAERLAGLDVPWWIAGGWALDLFIGRQTRAHDDIEIAVYRSDLEKLRSHLRGWDIRVAAAGELREWGEGEAPNDMHTLWARERGNERWQLEVVVEERTGDRWTYRRHPGIGANARDIGRRTAAGIPYLRPEIVLLYKSKGARGKDETDLITVLPHLDPAQRGFLAAALWTTAPGHRWLERLR